MFRDLKKNMFYHRIWNNSWFKKNMIVIERIDNLLTDSINIRLQTQCITRYVVNNVILTLFFFRNVCFHESKCFYQVLRILNNCNEIYSNDSWIYFFDEMSKYKKILIHVNCIDFKSMQAVFVYRDFYASKTLFLWIIHDTFWKTFI